MWDTDSQLSVMKPAIGSHPIHTIPFGVRQHEKRGPADEAAFKEIAEKVRNLGK